MVYDRAGYFPWAFDRRRVLESLHKQIFEKTKVIINKRVTRVVYKNSRPVVFCTDNTKYEGDVVVGADGVNSIVRSEMWRLCDLNEPEHIPPSDKEC